MLKSSKANRNDFANRVKTLRVRNSLTSAALAKWAGVSPAAIWQWENSGVIPRQPTLGKLATRLGVTTDFLLTGSGGYPEPGAIGSLSVSPAHHASDDLPLEDLIRAIEHKGFAVTLRSREA